MALPATLVGTIDRPGDVDRFAFEAKTGQELIFQVVAVSMGSKLRPVLTLYDSVVWNGYQFPGHWSWIYVARNDPKINGTSIWEWMARQRR